MSRGPDFAYMARVAEADRRLKANGPEIGERPREKPTRIKLVPFDANTVSAVKPRGGGVAFRMLHRGTKVGTCTNSIGKG